jgi:predicted polyphosphate/ATP-dependent NAD kinase
MPGEPRVGLIVNPHAGRDVRRLIAPASNLTNHERTNVVRRVLAGLRAAGVAEVMYMPDRYGLVARAAEDLPDLVVTPATQVCSDTPEDTLRATEAMVQANVRVLITHGGDGTNRLVAVGAGDVPILPIAAGTNNVFPTPVEATAAGFAAGVLSRHPAEEAVVEGCLSRHKRICVTVGDTRDIALVDAAATTDAAVASRAVWDPRRLTAFMVTRASPGTVGLAGLAGALVNIDPTEPRGAFIEMGLGTNVVAFMAPGLVVMADIRSVAEVQVGSSIQLESLTGVITLDGERSLVAREQKVHFALEADGPWVVETAAALRWAQRLGAFQMGDAERAHVGLFASLAGRHGVRAQG